MIKGALVFGAGALGTWVAVVWLSQSPSMWRKIGRLSVICALTGAILAAEPHRAGYVVAVLALGLLATVSSPISLLLPLPKLPSMNEVQTFAKRTSVWLAIATFYGTVFAFVGYLVSEVVLHMLMKAFLL